MRGLGRQIVTIFTSFLVVAFSILGPISQAPVSQVYAQEAASQESTEVTPAAEPPASLEEEVSESVSAVSPEPIISEEQSTSSAQDSADNQETQPAQAPDQDISNNDDDETEGLLEIHLIEEAADSSPDISDLLTFSEPKEYGASAQITTDKEDYAPTAAAVITGSNFDKDTTYTIVISSQDPPEVNFEDQITTDESGSFTYTYQLDGNYRPNYKVEVKDENGEIIASTTFTDTNTATL